jgi:hypothetical protein
MYRTTEADFHKQHTTDTKIHKQAHGKPLFPIADVCSGAALAMHETEPAGLHEEAADAVLEAIVGLAEANAKLPKDAWDILLHGEGAHAIRPGSRFQRHHGGPTSLYGEGCEAACTPLVLSVLRPLHFSVSLWAAASPEAAAAARWYPVSPGRATETSPTWSSLVSTKRWSPWASALGRQLRGARQPSGKEQLFGGCDPTPHRVYRVVHFFNKLVMAKHEKRRGGGHL